VSAYPGAGSFLADVKMQEPGRFAFSTGNLSGALKTTQKNHLLKQAEQYLLVRQIAGAKGLRFL
jgi:hypothetical protein